MRSPPEAPVASPVAATARGDARWILAIAAVALALRLAYLRVFCASPLHGVFLTDHRYYRDWGLRIAGGDWVGTEAFEQGPGYAYLLGLFYRIAGPRDDLLLLVQLLAGVGLTVLVFFCGRRLFDRPSAVAAALLAAAYGPLLFTECQVMKTFLEPLLVTLVLLVALRYADAGRLRNLVLAGAAVGALCLEREIHLLLLAPLSAWAWAAGGRLGLPARRRVAHLAAAALAAACLIAPATVRNWVVAGDRVLVTSAGGEVLYLSYGPNASAYYLNPPFVRARSRIEHEDFRDEARLRAGRALSRGEASRYWRGEALRAALASPARSLRLAAAKLHGLLNDYEYPDSEDYAVTRATYIPMLAWLPTLGWVVGLAAIGAARAIRRRRAALLLALLAACALEVLLTQAFARYRLVAVPLLLLAGHAVAWLLQRSRGPAPGVLPGRVAAAALAGAFSLWSFSAPPTRGGEGWVRWLAEDFRGEVSFRSGRRAQLTEALRQAQAEPHAARAQAALGDAYQAVGRSFEAEGAYRRALELEPGRAGELQSLADLYFQQGRFALAAERTRELLRLDAGNARAHLALGVFCSRLALASRDPREAGARRVEAGAHFREAARLSPQDASVPYYQGKFLAMAGDAAAALAELRRAVALSPEFPEARHALELVEGRDRS